MLSLQGPSARLSLLGRRDGGGRNRSNLSSIRAKKKPLRRFFGEFWPAAGRGHGQRKPPDRDRRQSFDTRCYRCTTPSSPPVNSAGSSDCLERAFAVHVEGVTGTQVTDLPRPSYSTKGRPIVLGRQPLFRVAEPAAFLTL